MIITLSVWDILIITIGEMIVLAIIEWFMFLKVYEIIEKHFREGEANENRI